MPHAYEEQYVQLILHQLLPPSDIPIDEHAKIHYVIPSEESARPGHFDIENTPYLKGIFDALHFNSKYKEVVFMKSTQVAGTMVGLCFLLWIAETGQEAPVLIVLPTERLAERFVKSKFRPMIENCKSLKEKISQLPNSESTLNFMRLPNGSVGFGNSNAANTLRSNSARVLYMDEVSDFPSDNGQGDPVELARARTTTFERNKKIFLVSTPNIEETCRITAAYKDTNQCKYFVPCPHCNHYQTIEWQNIKFKNTKHDGLQDIHLRCTDCGEKIYEEAKRWMLKRGEWRATAEHRDKEKIGFHINALYSLIGDTWESIIKEFLTVKDDPFMLHGWRNNKLGLPFKGSIEISKKQLNKRVEDYRIFPRLPKGVDLITCGVDFNEHHTNIEYVGWGRNYQSWGLDYIVIDKHISDPTLWIELNELISRRFIHYKGKEITVGCSVLDSNYSSDTVLNFVRKFHGDGRNIVAAKGRQGIGDPIISTKPSITEKKKVPFYSLSFNTSNETLFAWLNVKNKEDAGYCRFPKSYTTLKTEYKEEPVDFFGELTAVSMPTSGKNAGKWQKDQSKRQEANDCRRYAIAALYHLTHLGFDLSSHCDFFQKFDLDEVNEEIRKI